METREAFAYRECDVAEASNSTLDANGMDLKEGMEDESTQARNAPPQKSGRWVVMARIPSRTGESCAELHADLCT